MSHGDSVSGSHLDEDGWPTSSMDTIGTIRAWEDSTPLLIWQIVNRQNVLARPCAPTRATI